MTLLESPLLTYLEFLISSSAHGIHVLSFMDFVTCSAESEYVLNLLFILEM